MKPDYEEKGITLYLGDCLEIMKSIPDKSIDLVLTDPPYKVSQKYGGGVDADNLIAVSSIIKLMPEISRILKDDRFAVIFYDNRILPFLFEAIKAGRQLTKAQLVFKAMPAQNSVAFWLPTGR